MGKEIQTLAEKNGLQVIEHCSRGMPYDMTVNGMKVQCKKRKLLKNGTVDLCLARRKGTTKKAYLANDFDVLAMRCDGKTYLIPSQALAHKDLETMRNNIRPSEFVAFVNNWGVFGLSQAVPVETQSLFYFARGTDAQCQSNP